MPPLGVSSGSRGAIVETSTPNVCDVQLGGSPLIKFCSFLVDAEAEIKANSLINALDFIELQS